MNEERDRAIKKYWGYPVDKFGRAVWNAGVAHEQQRIADELDSILTSYGDNDRISDIHDYIEQLRERTK